MPDDPCSRRDTILHLFVSAKTILRSWRAYIFGKFVACHPQILLACGMNGQDSPPGGHGAPLSERIPRQLGGKSSKCLSWITLTEASKISARDGRRRRGTRFFLVRRHLSTLGGPPASALLLNGSRLYARHQSMSQHPQTAVQNIITRKKRQDRRAPLP